jgi:acetoin utilization deacetylase AcuC-like enzyme
MEASIEELEKHMGKLDLKKNTVGYVFDERMLLHKDFNSDHSERPERAMVIYSNLLLKDLTSQLFRLPSEEILEIELESIHPMEYIQSISKLKYKTDKDGNQVERAKTESFNTFAYDTYDNYFTYDSAKVSAGSLLSCCKAVNYGQVQHAFAIIRPPGHHANNKQCRGFCFFNNVAVSVDYLIKKCKKKVAIVDWDVHHGDGTQEIFYGQQNPLMISLHRYDNGHFYPAKTGSHTEIGEGEGKWHNINIPWNTEYYNNSNSFIGDDEYFYAFETIVLPVLRDYKPDIILVSCGFDAAENDPLGGLSLTPVGYSYMTNALKSVCNNVIVALEGGYNLNSLSRCSEAIIRTLLGEENPFKDLLLKSEINNLSLSLNDLNASYFKPSKKIVEHVNMLKAYYEEHWKCLTNVTLAIPESKILKVDNKESVEEFLKIDASLKDYLFEDPNSDVLQTNDYVRIKMGRSTFPEDFKTQEKKSKRLNVDLRTTTNRDGYRIEAIALRDLKTKSHLYNWTGRYGYYMIKSEDISTIFQKFFNTKKIRKDETLNLLRSFYEKIEKLLNNEIDLFNVDIVFYVGRVEVEKLSSTRSKTKPNLELKLNGLKSYSIKKSSTKNFLSSLNNLITLIDEEVIF